MSRIVITHGYSDSNKGDLAIVIATINIVKRLLPDAKVTLQSVYSEDDPQFNHHTRFTRSQGVRVEEGILPSPYIDNEPHGMLRNLKAAIRLIKNILYIYLFNIFSSPLFSSYAGQFNALESLKYADLVIVKGGQFIYNDQGGLRGFLYLWRILKSISLPAKLGKTVILLGHSIGPIRGAYALRMVRKTLSRCKAIVVREEITANLMRDIGLTEKVFLAPDIAFLIEPEEPTERNDIKSMLDNDNWLGVTVTNWSFNDSKKPDQKRREYIEVMIRVLTEVYKRWKLKIIFFPQVSVKSHGESDLDLIELLLNNLKENGVDAEYADGDLSPSKLCYLYGRCRVLLGTRLHSCILAACAGTPVVAIRYQGHKTEGVMANLGLQEFVHDINSLDERSILNSIEKAYSTRDVLSETIKRRVDYCRSDLEIVLHKLIIKGERGKSYN
ncbi:MAG: polysaccharide pyruvyl transferase family protein [Firmicutes bacterium]|nr:polysaccharide pyruvyl transferase family protein [Bacillota bacterium]